MLLLERFSAQSIAYKMWNSSKQGSLTVLSNFKQPEIFSAKLANWLNLAVSKWSFNKEFHWVQKGEAGPGLQTGLGGSCDWVGHVTGWVM